MGEDNTKNDWVLDIDTDEIVSDEMADEIIKIFNTGEPNCDGFLTPIITIPPFGNPWYNFSKAHRVKLYKKSLFAFPHMRLGTNLRLII